jgi:[ribosomal protein S5]-alanine N-acetyltransferase
MSTAFDAIETAQLVIRPYAEADIGAAQELLGDAETMAFWPRPFTSAEAADWVRANMARITTTIYGRCALLLKESGEVIGDVGVIRATSAGAERDDLGYIVHRRYWGQGYATEAALALRDLYFGEFRLGELFANMAADHHGSRRVAEKIGMRRLLEFHNPRNRGLLTYLYAITRAELEPQ